MKKWKWIYLYAFIGVLCLVFSPLLFGADGLSSFTVQLPTGVTALEFTPLVYQPEAVVTNTVYEWVEVDVLRTNGLFAGGSVETNTVQQQVGSDVVSTNEAVWTTTFPKVIPASVFLSVDENLDASFRREAVADVRLSLSPAELRFVLGDDLYGLTLQSAQTFGSVPVQGQLETTLRSVVASVVGSD